MSPLKAQLILGHSDASLTAKVYTHLDAEDLREAVELLGEQRPGVKAKEAR